LNITEKDWECFDKLSTNGKCPIILNPAPFALRLSKGNGMFLAPH
jgi:hypothetical protein